MKGFQLHTFGCKVNVYDSGLIQKNMIQNGFSYERKTGQVHILNTCAVTQEATKEAVRMIRRIKSKDPFATVVVTGCAAQVDTGSFSELPGVDLVIANSHKGYLPFLLDQHFKGVQKEKVYKSNIFKKEDLEANGGTEETHTRAFLKIQDGCNSFCSYCIIPYARGLSRSIGVMDLVRRVNELYMSGYREVVLTGVHIGDYHDEARSDKNKLEDLLEALLKNTKMPRFRLTSFEPLELTSRLMELFQDERLCPHFHMSIQSANTEVLRLMKRKYTQDDVIHSLKLIEKMVPGAFVGMDVIVGFPQETESHFEDTYKILSELPWTRIHVFPYSERQGTKATLLENPVKPSDRKSRASQLRELSRHRYQAELMKQKGTRKKVLILNDKKAIQGSRGLTRDYWPVNLNLSNLQSGLEMDVYINDFNMDESIHAEGLLMGVQC